jgi:hypothetical protein
MSETETNQIDPMGLEEGDRLRHKETGNLWEVATWTDFEGFLDDDPFRDYRLLEVGTEGFATVCSKEINDRFEPA